MNERQARFGFRIVALFKKWLTWLEGAVTPAPLERTPRETVEATRRGGRVYLGRTVEWPLYVVSVIGDAWVCVLMDEHRILSPAPRYVVIARVLRTLESDLVAPRAVVVLRGDLDAEDAWPHGSIPTLRDCVIVNVERWGQDWTQERLPSKVVEIRPRLAGAVAEISERKGGNIRD